MTNTTSIPVIAGLSCDPECSIDASLECRYEHKQRNNDSKIGCVLNQNYHRPRLPVVELTGSFCHSTAGRGWTVLLTHQGPFLSLTRAIYLSSLDPRYGGFRIADYFSCVIRLTLASHQHGIGFALINGKRGTGVSRYAPQTRI